MLYGKESIELSLLYQNYCSSLAAMKSEKHDVSTYTVLPNIIGWCRSLSVCDSWMSIIQYYFNFRVSCERALININSSTALGPICLMVPG